MKFSLKKFLICLAGYLNALTRRFISIRNVRKNTARMRGVILQKAKPRLPLRYMRISEHYDA